ncbi:MAG: hypothetical protein HZA21_05320 [Nitrospirae bacterium]|nr:hypothetical protein [Nitrospirota bacterium]
MPFTPAPSGIGEAMVKTGMALLAVVGRPDKHIGESLVAKDLSARM